MLINEKLSFVFMLAIQGTARLTVLQSGKEIKEKIPSKRDNSLGSETLSS